MKKVRGQCNIPRGKLLFHKVPCILHGVKIRRVTCTIWNSCDVIIEKFHHVVTCCRDLDKMCGTLNFKAMQDLVFKHEDLLISINCTVLKREEWTSHIIIVSVFHCLLGEVWVIAAGSQWVLNLPYIRWKALEGTHWRTWLLYITQAWSLTTSYQNWDVPATSACSIEFFFFFLTWEWKAGWGPSGAKVGWCEKRSS